MILKLHRERTVVLEIIHQALADSKRVDNFRNLRFYSYNGEPNLILSDTRGALIGIVIEDIVQCPQQLLYNQKVLDSLDNAYPFEVFVEALKYIERLIQLSVFW